MLALGEWGAALGLRRFIARMAGRWATAIRGTLDQAWDTPDVQQIGDLISLIIEARILAGDADGAANEIPALYRAWSLIGRPNNAPLADRLSAWVHLANGRRTQAVRDFARGFWRALESRDDSLRAKLGANTVRALWGGSPKGSEWDCTLSDEPPDVVEACKVLAFLTESSTVEHPWFTAGTPAWGAAQTVTRAVQWRYGRAWSALRQELARYRNLRGFPVYHSGVRPERF